MEAIAAWAARYKNPAPPEHPDSSPPAPVDAYDQSYWDIHVENVHDNMNYDRDPRVSYV